ncbi:MAG: endopeptidase La [Sutterellaceae bacterium]|nr:endopeptidase La [Sutterellaceae bacterium]
MTTELETTDKVVMPLLPIRDLVVFPRMVIPLFVGRPKTVRAVQLAAKEKNRIILVTQKDSKTDEPTYDDVYHIGTEASILQMLKLPDGTLKVLVEAHRRVRILSLTYAVRTSYRSEIEYCDSVLGEASVVEASRRTALQRFFAYAKDSKKVTDDTVNSVRNVKGASETCDAIACNIPVSIENKQKLLEELNVQKRYALLLDFIAGETDILAVEKRIQGRVKKQMEQSQRNYYLQEQMKAIQKELGGDEDGAVTDDFKVYKDRIAAAGMTKEAEEKAQAELKKLRMMQPMSAEATVIRGYLDTLLELPWKAKTEVSTDLKKAAEVLDHDHWGLEKVKERILEYLAVQRRVDKVKAPILCLVGAPGVGKTSLGESIARATGRKYVRMALGGVHDESEIRGHRRTYIGSMPGKVIQSLTKVGVRNPLFLLDEIDKLGRDHRGDPASALLEVLDPEQNRTFSDHYVDVDFDLSDVMFVATSNSYDIPPALLDRMEVISLSGYTEEEKLHIAERHLIPKQRELNGMKKTEADITEDAVRDIIRYYTREAGVRGLERSIGKVFRKIVRMHCETEDENAAKAKVAEATDAEVKTAKRAKRVKKIVVTAANLADYLGVRKFQYGIAQTEPQVGQVNGLAWTEVGGDILTVEAVSFPGKGVVQRTGSLGDVMKESVDAARTVVRARAEKLGIDPAAFGNTDWHIHFPEGATPKDGPSAGAAITTAIVSAMTGIAVRPDVAMTGEITLRGEVLEIGGLKEKLLAALRGGIKKVLIPESNVKDLAEIPDNVKTGMEIVPVRWIDKVLDEALVRKPQSLQPKAKEQFTVALNVPENSPKPQGSVVSN